MWSPNSHTHSNKTTLDKLGDSGNILTYNGAQIGVGGVPAYNPNQWSGKIWNAMGDSITALRYPPNHYLDLLKSSLGFASFNNYGQSSNTLMGTGGMAERILSMATNADLITILGGTNDYGTSSPMGTMSDRTVSTVYGALHRLCIDMMTTYPNAKYAFFTPTKRAGSNTPNTPGYTLLDIADTILKVAGYYSIPVLDLTRKTGFDPDITQHKTLYMSDGIHPDGPGHIRIAKVMELFLLGI